MKRLRLALAWPQSLDRLSPRYSGLVTIFTASSFRSGNTKVFLSRSLNIESEHFSGDAASLAHVLMRNQREYQKNWCGLIEPS